MLSSLLKELIPASGDAIAALLGGSGITSALNNFTAGRNQALITCLLFHLKSSNERTGIGHSKLPNEGLVIFK